MSFDRGDIVIVPFPFVSREGESAQKARPALVVSDETIDRRYTDRILAAITSQIPSFLQETELELSPTQANGLKKTSIVRAEFLMTVPETVIARKIGKVTSTQMKQINAKLSLSLGLGRT